MFGVVADDSSVGFPLENATSLSQVRLLNVLYDTIGLSLDVLVAMVMYCMLL